MKKSTKIIASALVLSLLIGGTGYAAVKKYKGCPIVNVLINGKTYSGDVPAVLVDKKVWVSAKVVDKIGAKSSYSKSSNKLNITWTDKSIAINDMKFYNDVTEYYYRLENLGEMIQILSDKLSLSFEDINRNNNISYLDATDKNYQEAIDNYNSFIDPVNDLILYANKKGININDMDTILNYYSKALDEYEASSKGLRNYYYNKSDNNFNNYFDKRMSLWDDAFNGKKLSSTGVLDFIDMVRNR